MAERIGLLTNYAYTEGYYEKTTRKNVCPLIAATVAVMVLAGCGAAGSSAVTPAATSAATSSPAQNVAAVPGESIATNGGDIIPLTDLEHQDSTAASTVYYTSAITSEAILTAYEQLGWELTGKVAIKLSTGKPPASNYLSPDLIKDLVQSVDGTIVENNTAYGGQRSATAMHWQVIADHGFLKIAEADILDEEGSMTLPVEGGTQLSENLVGSHFSNYDSYIVLSHFKGHAMAGFGVLMAATIGVPLYVCGGGTIPLLQQWLVSGMSAGAAVSFMITGPPQKSPTLVR